ncbi:putative phenylalanine--tRNA ligase [Helianthus annuus]|uniref:Phenylalanyl tRNA synthetase beta chain core domain-containing protein n=1 Tax=Helianthus annuus TaxID=4232 RepID=A0A251UKF4_HELAN|nr:putative phenylalanine--tRNA ligase [Helianthus annuus]KAJ0741873.1 putative phenylalanine--tRNA ligase [Helianthus annuus]
MLNRKDDKSTAVVIGNPRSADFEVVRSSLMAGILKTTAHSKDHPKPIKIFEVGDVTVFDELKDVGATNHRQLAALYCGATSGFEVKLCFLNIIFPNMKI